MSGNWIFDSCRFTKLDYGYLSNDSTRTVVFTNCSFSELVKGIVLGTNPTSADIPQHYKIVNNEFDKIATFAVQVDSGQKILSQGNSYRDVGNSQNGFNNPTVENIRFYGTDCSSVNDVFDRPLEKASLVPWVDYGADLGTTIGISSVNNLVTSSGFSKILYNNTLTPSTLGVEVPKSARGFEFVYTVGRRIGPTEYTRKGRLTATGVASADEYSETGPVGVVFSINESASKLNYAVKYTMNNSSPSADAMISGYFQYNIVPSLPGTRFNISVDSATGFTWVIPALVVPTTTTTAAPTTTTTTAAPTITTTTTRAPTTTTTTTAAPTTTTTTAAPVTTTTTAAPVTTTTTAAPVTTTTQPPAINITTFKTPVGCYFAGSGFSLDNIGGQIWLTAGAVPQITNGATCQSNATVSATLLTNRGRGLNNLANSSSSNLYQINSAGYPQWKMMDSVRIDNLAVGAKVNLNFTTYAASINGPGWPYTVPSGMPNFVITRTGTNTATIKLGVSAPWSAVDPVGVIDAGWNATIINWFGLTNNYFGGATTPIYDPAGVLLGNSYTIGEKTLTW
jgi:hypothetical protein